MTPLTIYQDNICKVTTVSNYFIDEYMPNANAAQIKIYLYLLRRIGEGLSTSVCEMADFLNYPEKDVIRALQYWEKQGLLKLDFNEERLLVGIHMCSYPQGNTKPSPVHREKNPVATETNTPKEVSKDLPQKTSTMDESIKKPAYSLDDIKEFKENEATSELLFIVETYLRRPLSLNEIQTIYFFMEKLNMSVDLIDYLFQYCIERGHTGFHYIETVAINWAQNGIKSPKEAKEFSYKYAKIVYTVMKALGKSTVPTDEEASYVHTWSNDLGFTDDIILEACKRSVMGTDKNRLQYANNILTNWKEKKVISIKDIEKLDEEFKKQKTIAPTPKPSYKKGSFYQFEQRDYDFDALEKQLISN